MSASEEAMAYWRRQLAPLPQETALPVDLPYPPVSAENRRTRGRTLDVTAPETSLLAAYVALLHRYGRSGEISVGYDGLPLRIGLSGETSFGELERLSSMDGFCSRTSTG